MNFICINMDYLWRFKVKANINKGFMEKEKELKLLKEMLKKQLYCLGRIFARHEVPDDVIWEVVKGFDLIYQRIKKQSEMSIGKKESDSNIYKMEPHPGLTYILEKIEK